MDFMGEYMGPLLALGPYNMAPCRLSGPMAPGWLPKYKAPQKFGSVAPVGFPTTWP